MNNKVISLILGLSFVVGCFAQGLPVLGSCIICSSFTNITCATNPDSHIRLPCERNTQVGCYTRIVDGHTLRGCLSELDADVVTACYTPGTLCEICSDPANPTLGCNNAIYPEHRRQCHQCRGPVNGTCDAIPLELPTVCEVFDANDRCFIHRTLTGITRGCLSDRQNPSSMCQDPSHCYTCELTGCNNFDGNSNVVPIAPGSAVTNKISFVMLSTAFIFALAKFI